MLRLLLLLLLLLIKVRLYACSCIFIVFILFYLRFCTRKKYFRDIEVLLDTSTSVECSG